MKKKLRFRVLFLLLSILTLLILVAPSSGHAEPAICIYKVSVILLGEEHILYPTNPFQACYLSSPWFTVPFGSGPDCSGTFDDTLKVCWSIVFHRPPV